MLSPAQSKKVIQLLDKEGVQAAQQDEVNMLIKKLGSMSIDNPNYPQYYYRAVKMDPDAWLVLKPPVSIYYRGQQDNTNRQSPALSSTSNPATTAVNHLLFFYYDYGKPGHNLNNCPDIFDLASKGVIKKDKTGKYIFADGSGINGNGNKPIVIAAKCSSPSSNLITSITYAMIEEVSDSEDEQIYAAVHIEKTSKEKRKEKFNEVYVQPKPK